MNEQRLDAPNGPGRCSCDERPKGSARRLQIGGEKLLGEQPADPGVAVGSGEPGVQEPPSVEVAEDVQGHACCAQRAQCRAALGVGEQGPAGQVGGELRVGAAFGGQEGGVGPDTEKDVLRADGGASANDFLLQFQADMPGATIRRPSNVEATASGAAYLAGLGVGIWSDPQDCFRETGDDAVFTPSIDHASRDANYTQWQRAVERAKGWAVQP
ncbi:FGGY-family carbohydrate kinase [Streptomyces sp. NPDC004609]|uniref:FGGY-family carbohydrate kinase n=1 Tax=Streptomyces sp. NPDC004609 TaxID=3364704 RepID=UPI003686CE2C